MATRIARRAPVAVRRRVTDRFLPTQPRGYRDMASFRAEEAKPRAFSHREL